MSSESQIGNISISNRDTVEGMKSLNDSSIDLAIADPPYGASTHSPSHLKRDHDLAGFGGTWTAANQAWDHFDLNTHMAFAISWLSELKRVVKPEGSIWVHCSYHNSGIINVACQLLEMEIINEVVWFKRNSFPNLRARRLTASHETLLWVHTGGKSRKYRFNYEKIKKMTYESDNLKFANKQMRTVWDIPNNKSRDEFRNGKHPTQKPERLIQRLIDISAPDSGMVLSPFLGSGTDLVVAMKNGLSGIGFETDLTYFKIAESRLRSSQSDLEHKLL